MIRSQVYNTGGKNQFSYCIVMLHTLLASLGENKVIHKLGPVAPFLHCSDLPVCDLSFFGKY